jgi:hypothetical protein
MHPTSVVRPFTFSELSFTSMVDRPLPFRILPPTVNYFIRQLGLSTAAKRRWQSYANVDGYGDARLSGMNVIPAHIAFDRCDSLATNSGEPMI